MKFRQNLCYTAFIKIFEKSTLLKYVTWIIEIAHLRMPAEGAKFKNTSDIFKINSFAPLPWIWESILFYNNVIKHTKLNMHAQQGLHLD